MECRTRQRGAGSRRLKRRFAAAVGKTEILWGVIPVKRSEGILKQIATAQPRLVGTVLTSTLLRNTVLAETLS